MPQKKESQPERKEKTHNTHLKSNNAKISRISSVTAMQSKREPVYTDRKKTITNTFNEPKMSGQLMWLR